MHKGFALAHLQHIFPDRNTGVHLEELKVGVTEDPHQDQTMYQKNCRICRGSQGLHKYADPPRGVLPQVWWKKALPGSLLNIKNNPSAL
ncbi:MAG: hypothetical protein WAU51_00280 [Methanoregula sp.]